MGGTYGMHGIAAGCKLVALKIKRNNKTSILHFLHALHDAATTKDIDVVSCSLGNSIPTITSDEVFYISDSKKRQEWFRATICFIRR